MDMTIGEMIETYANFDKTREFYNLYKEAVAVDLKVRYALTESYMQESSIDAILEGSDFWGSIKTWSIKIWEAIKKFFKNIWFHITRFFHSIFNRSDKMYQAEAAYDKKIKASYALAIRKTQGKVRERPIDIFEQAVMRTAVRFGFYDNSDKAARITDKIDKSILEKLKFLSKIHSTQPSTTTPKNSSPSPGPQASDPKSAIDRLNLINETIVVAYECQVGFKFDNKKVDAICQILNEKRINEKIESFADLLNTTNIICKPPLSIQIPEKFDILMRKTEDLTDKLRQFIKTGNKSVSAMLTKYTGTIMEVAERKTDRFIDVIVDERYVDKVTKINKDLLAAIREFSDNVSGSFSDKGLDNERLTVSRIDNKSPESVYTGFTHEGEAMSDIISDTIKDSVADKMDNTKIVESLGAFSLLFSVLSKGITKIYKAIELTVKFRSAIAEAIYTMINNRFNEE